MRIDKFTYKVQEAVGNMQSIAESYGHQKIEPEHLMISLS